MYLVEFSNELSIPSGNTITVSPSGYSIKNAKSFTPQCFVKIKSTYTEGSQTLVKLTVKDINYDVLKTQYKRIICSPTPEKPWRFTTPWNPLPFEVPTTSTFSPSSKISQVMVSPMFFPRL